MPYTKTDLKELGTTLRDTLASVGQTIKKNKLDAKKEEIMTKYQNPDKIMFDKSGASKSPDKIAQTVFPDANWLISNGYTNEANYLGNSFKEFNAQLNTREQNRAFIKSLDESEQEKYKGFNLDRGDALAVHKEGRITKGGGYSGARTKTYVVNNVYEDGTYYSVTYAYDPGLPNQEPKEVKRVPIDNMPTESSSYNRNVSTDTSRGAVSWYGPNGEITNLPSGQVPPKGFMSEDAWFKQKDDLQHYREWKKKQENGDNDGTFKIK